MGWTNFLAGIILIHKSGDLKTPNLHYGQTGGRLMPIDADWVNDYTGHTLMLIHCALL